MHIKPGLLTEPKLVFSDSAAIGPVPAGLSALRFMGVTPIHLAFGFITPLLASSNIPLVVKPLITFLMLWVLNCWGKTHWADDRFIAQPVLKTRIAS